MERYIWTSVLFSLLMLPISWFVLISNHTQGKLNCSTYETFLSVSSQGNVYLIHTRLFCLHVHLHSFCLPLHVLVCLFLLCLTLPDGFSVSGLGDWFQLWAAGRRAACTLMCSRNCTLWRITGLLIHSRDRVSKTWEEWKKPYWNCNARTGEKSKKRGKRKQVNM